MSVNCIALKCNNKDPSDITYNAGNYSHAHIYFKRRNFELRPMLGLPEYKPLLLLIVLPDITKNGEGDPVVMSLEAFEKSVKKS